MALYDINSTRLSSLSLSLSLFLSLSLSLSPSLSLFFTLFHLSPRSDIYCLLSRCQFSLCILESKRPENRNSILSDSIHPPTLTRATPVMPPATLVLQQPMPRLLRHKSRHQLLQPCNSPCHATSVTSQTPLSMPRPHYHATHYTSHYPHQPPQVPSSKPVMLPALQRHLCPFKMPLYVHQPLSQTSHHSTTGLHRHWLFLSVVSPFFEGEVKTFTFTGFYCSIKHHLGTSHHHSS